MDRDHELAQNYGDISRGSREVEGEWYLREIVWEDGREVTIANRLKDNGCFEGCGPGMTVDKMREWGWKITPVEIFRKR